MSVIEKFSAISNTLTKLFNFLTHSDATKNDLEEYFKTISVKTSNEKNLQALLLPYLFERRLNNKTIFNIYLENTKITDKLEKNIISSLEHAFESIFEIKKTEKNSFVLYNLINEKEYTVFPLVKMSNFRGVVPGQFILARIFELEKTFYLIEISDVYASYQKDEIYRFSVAKLLEKPELLYEDNANKLQELEKLIADFSVKFEELFNSDEIISDNKSADSLISIFNDYCEFDKKPTTKEIQKLIKEPDEFKFFNVQEFNSQYDNFLENSIEGFSKHSQTYDIGIIFDKTCGLYIIPFWATLNHGFKTDYKTIDNFKKCLLSVLENDKIPPSIFERLNNRYTNFLPTVNEILEKKYTFDELMHFYKSDYFSKKIFSPTSVLYAANIFTDAIKSLEKTQIQKEQSVITECKKVRPNEPCPCGSGKKYKKCCGSNS